MSLVGTTWVARDPRDVRRVIVVEDDGMPHGFVAVRRVDTTGMPVEGARRSRIRKIGQDLISRYERVTGSK